MKTFKNIAAQGDAMLKRVDSVPEGYEPAPIVNGEYIVAHSETGHCHVIEASKSAQMLINQTNDFIAYIKVEKDTELKHKRSFDTHESLLLKKGIYEVRRQREYTPEGYRRAQD